MSTTDIPRSTSRSSALLILIVVGDDSFLVAERVDGAAPFSQLFHSFSGWVNCLLSKQPVVHPHSHSLGDITENRPNVPDKMVVVKDFDAKAHPRAVCC